MRLFILTLLLAVALPAAGEEPTPTAPARPSDQKQTKRTITASAVLDLCTLTDVRSCGVWNQTDVTIAVQYVTGPADCGTTSIDPAADTDLVLIPPGGTYSSVIGEKSNGRDHTLCGIAAATVNRGSVFTVETTTNAPQIIMTAERTPLDLDDDGDEILTALGDCAAAGVILTDADANTQGAVVTEYLVTCNVETCYLCAAATCAAPDGIAIPAGGALLLTPSAASSYACRSVGSSGELRMTPRK